MADQLALYEGSDLRAAQRGEYVSTPAWFTRALLSAAGLWPWSRRILDAGAGLGEIAGEVERWAAEVRPGRQNLPYITALEREPDRSLAQPEGWARECADLFDWAPAAARRRQAWPIILTNPPFSRWKEWCEALLPLLEPEGRLLVVLPWEYLSRAQPWWMAHPAKRAFRVGRRPWKVETREACWVEWERGYRGPTTLEWMEGGR